MPLRLRSLPTLLLALSASAAVTIACGDDKGTGEEHGGNTPAVCQEIITPCHDADTGAGMAHDCHEQAEEGDAAQCETIHDECIAFCTGGTGTETGTTMTTTTMTATTDATDTDEGTTHADDESTTHQDAESTDGGTGHDSGSETGAATSCDILGSGCHDNKTPEGIACHEIGHDGDVAACDEALAECSKICGL